MKSISETPLPGIGIRYEFTTEAGQPIGVVLRRDGDRDFLVYSREDPDTCKVTLRLDASDVAALIDALGGSEVVTRHQEQLHQSLEGIELEWIAIPADAAANGSTIAESSLRRRTGASIVSVIRGEQITVSPTSEFRLEAGDTVVVVGSPETVAQARDALTHA